MQQTARPAMEFIKGLVWIIVFGALFFGVAVASFLGGQAIGHITAAWVSPLVRGVVAIGGITLVTWLVRVRLNRRSWAGMALPRPQIAQLLLGCFCGALVILSVGGIEYMVGWLHIAGISTTARLGVPNYVMILLELVPSLGTGFSEELAFRGYIFQTLGERAPVWVAALATGVIFGLIHFSVAGFGVSFVLSVTLISVMFLVMRFVTGSLWFPIGFHAMFDWTQTYLVGLSTTGDPHDPSLIHISQSGPSLWVGGGQAMDPGLFYVFAAVLTTILALAYGKCVGRTVPWRRRLSANGQSV
jgi:membrane protease YdiL (CAAX protease family)